MLHKNAGATGSIWEHKEKELGPLFLGVHCCPSFSINDNMSRFLFNHLGA